VLSLNLNSLSLARELSGVPDGRGGVLPTIKQPIGTAIPPTIPEDHPLAFPITEGGGALVTSGAGNVPAGKGCHLT